MARTTRVAAVMSGGPVQRAPRLRPDQRLADAMTSRAGRFTRIDPRTGRSLPKFAHVVGVLAWAGLLAESFRRARQPPSP